MSGIGTCCDSGVATPGGPVLLTAARTACPLATSSRQRTAPTKPDAPVTRMRMMSNRGDAASLFSLRRGILASLYLQAIRATTIRALSERKAERVAVSFYPVILSGGSGSRLWPMSRRLLPKQFLPLVSERSLLQDTVLRLRGLDGAGSPIVVSNDEHRFLVAEQMREIGVQPEVQILEPVGRNTAPAVAVVALYTRSRHPDACLLVLPSDHLIREVPAFHAAIAAALPLAASGSLVTFGIAPQGPVTGYGYIERGEPIPGSERSFRVRRFVEKPDAETAQSYVSSGRFFWNSGMFAFRPGRFLEELQRFRPEILAAAKSAWEASTRDLDFLRLERCRLVGRALGGQREGCERQRRPRRRGPARGERLLRSRRAPHGGGAGSARPRRRRDQRRGSRGRQGARAGGQGSGRAPRPAGPHRARFARPGPPALGVLRKHRRRRALSGQAHRGEARRGAVAADAQPSRGALGGGVRHRESDARRGSHAPRGERIHVYPDRRQASPRKSGKGTALSHRSPVGQLSGGG